MDKREVIYDGANNKQLLPVNYNKETKTFSSEISDLNWERAPRCVTITVKANGHSKDFMLMKVHTNDGDLTHWEYKADGGFKLVIFND